MDNERTLTILKPGNFGYCLEIFWCLEDLLGKIGGFSRTIPSHIFRIPEEIMKKHYENISNLPNYQATVDAFVHSEDGIVTCVYSGKNIIKRVRDAIGHTDSQKAEPWTVRAIFGKDSLEVAAREKRYLNNVIHASSSIKDAEREIVLWKEYL